MTYQRSQVSKPSFSELSPDLQYKIWKKINRQGSFIKFCDRWSWRITFLVCLPGVAFVAIPQINGVITSTYAVAQFFGNVFNPLGNVEVTMQALDDEQKQVAADIIKVGNGRKATDKQIKIALMVAKQESGMKNINHGDDWFFQQNGMGDTSDSAGVFQQRSHWGDLKCRTDVKCAAGLFYDRLLAIPKDTIEHEQEWQIAASIQRPAKEYERHYDQWNGLAKDIMQNVSPTKPFNPFKWLVPGDDGWVKPHNGMITSPYGMRLHPIKGVMKLHKGTDYAANTGDPIKASRGGTVTVATDENDGYGIKIVLDHGNGYQSMYCHLSETTVTPGTRINQSDVVGKAGSTGSSTAPHLHFEIIKDGTAIDPQTLLQK